MKNKRFTCALLVLILLRASYASQSIQIHAQLPDNSPNSEFLLIIDDIDQGTKTPVQINLHAGQNLQTFSVHGEHYQVVPATIQAPNVQFTPCAPSSLIDHRSLIITITGKIEPEALQCTYREIATLPQLYTPVNRASEAMNVAPTKNDVKTGYAEMAKYLTSLSNHCEAGKFHAGFETQFVDYTILGIKNGVCEVSISANASQKPLICHFNTNDIALIAAPSRISEVAQGQVSYSPNDLSTRIMKARCK